jgi:hypothetical protein
MPSIRQIASTLERRYMVARNRMRLRPTDVFVASYPRSGNTWMRHLLSDAILQTHGLHFDPDVGFTIHPDRIIPDMYLHDIRHIDPRIRLPFRLVKTHRPFGRMVSKAVYLFRLPEDALVSYYHHHLRYEHLRSRVTSGPDRFCTENVGTWCANVGSYIQGKEIGEAQIQFVSYESMHQRPAEILQGVMEFLGIPVDQEICQTAVENNTFEKKRGREQLREEHHEYFFRKGKVGSGKEELRIETIDAIRAVAGPLYSVASNLQEL